MTASLRALAATLVLGICAPAQDPPRAEPPFAPIFNGTDLAGWVVVNGAPSTWTVAGDAIRCSGKPAGFLRTEKVYENFVFEVEWRHLKAGGNAGIFVWADPLPARGVPFPRSVEVQVMDGTETPDYTSDGDIFSIHGAGCVPDRPHPKGWARCLPSEKRAKPSPEWNHYRIVCKDGAIQLAVNGAVVSGVHDVKPRRGHLALEAEGSDVEFRNLRVQELPPAAAPLGEDSVCAKDEGFRTLYDGTALAGWKENEAKAGHWTSKDWILDYDGKGDHLWSAGEFEDFELIVDWRWSGKPADEPLPVVLPDGEMPLGEDGKPKTQVVPNAGDSGIYLRGNDKSQVNIWCWPVGSGEVYGYRTDAAQPAEVRAAVTPKVRADAPIGQWNRFRISMKGERLDVWLNGQAVITGARLPGVPRRGALALQHHGSPLQFANLFIRGG